MGLISGIEDVGSKKTDKKQGYDHDYVQEQAQQREKIAYASLPGLLNGSANPSKGTESTQTAFNA